MAVLTLSVIAVLTLSEGCDVIISTVAAIAFANSSGFLTLRA